MNLSESLNKWIKFKYPIECDKTENKSLQYKILILGDPGVGKSSICTRLCQNEFNLEIKSNDHPECYTKNLKLFEYNIKLFLIDIDKNIMTTNDITNLFSDVLGAVVVYDITKSKTFEKIDKWILELKHNTHENLPIFIIGNKKDLTYLRNVDQDEGIEKAKANDCEFYEVSCVENFSVRELFKIFVSLIFFRDLPESKIKYFKNYFSSLHTVEKD